MLYATLLYEVVYISGQRLYDSFHLECECCGGDGADGHLRRNGEIIHLLVSVFPQSLHYTLLLVR